MNKDIYPLTVTVCADILKNFNSYRLSQMICEFTHKLDDVVNIDGKDDISNMLLEGIDISHKKMKSNLLSSITANCENIDIERVNKLIDSDDGYHELIDLLISYFLTTRANDKSE